MTSTMASLTFGDWSNSSLSSLPSGSVFSTDRDRCTNIVDDLEGAASDSAKQRDESLSDTVNLHHVGLHGGGVLGVTDVLDEHGSAVSDLDRQIVKRFEIRDHPVAR